LNPLGSLLPVIRPDECLVIEDSVAGVQAAKNAGMRCLAVTNSYSAEELGRADWVVPSLAGCDVESLFASTAMATS
jgi:beta-phosphoglucomutase-like phosphatase (HAD superfamily)